MKVQRVGKTVDDIEKSANVNSIYDSLLAHISSMKRLHIIWPNLSRKPNTVRSFSSMFAVRQSSKMALTVSLVSLYDATAP
jgi:hypothetical protein